MIITAIVWYFIGALAGLTLFLIGAEAIRDAKHLVRHLIRRVDADASAVAQDDWSSREH